MKEKYLQYAPKDKTGVQFKDKVDIEHLNFAIMCVNTIFYYCVVRVDLYAPRLIR